MELYRGLGYERAMRVVAGAEQIAATSNGEFGSGSYYWLNDLPAGILSAVQYYGQEKGGWAVLKMEVGKSELGDFPRGSILNFRDGGGSSSFDPSTNTARRKVTFPDETEHRLTFSEFRDINANPDAHGLTGIKNKLPWPNYPIIAGPTAAAPKDVNLTQIKFANQGIDVLNNQPKQIVMHGPQLNASTFKTVRTWTLDNRESIYLKYFNGQTAVTLVF